MTDGLEYYESLRYPIELIDAPEGGFVAQHPDLEGCMAQGETADEAVAALAAARHLWLQARVEDGLAIPEPMEESTFGGRFLLRLPRSVHARLARRASRDGVSLNQYIGYVLAEHLGAMAKRRVSESRAQEVAALNLLTAQFRLLQTPTMVWSTTIPMFIPTIDLPTSPVVADASALVNQRVETQAAANTSSPPLRVVRGGGRS